MIVGGCYLVPGTVLDIADGDYLYGKGEVYLFLNEIIEVRRHWIVIKGMEKVRNGGPWRERTIQLKITAIRRSLVMSAPLSA